MLPTHAPAPMMRQAGRAALAQALGDARSRLLRLAHAFEQVLPPDQAVRYTAEVNPPRWELGHIAWFEEYWIARNPLRAFGDRAPHLEARGASLYPAADRLFNSSTVEHTRRWHLDLPDLGRARRYLEQTRERTLALLTQADDSDDALYAFRLALFHEDMHREAWAMMGQSLALPVGAALDAVTPAPVRHEGEIEVAGGLVDLGCADSGFAFDNERPAHRLDLPPFRIDRSPVSWQRFLPFIDAGGYDQSDWWTPAGWAWRQRHSTGRPRHLLREDGVWQRAAFGQWLPLVPEQPAVNLSQHEAEAWCRWAGRRLPSEAEWEVAATTRPDDFDWGQVWEWTASPFVPYAGFEAHPYRDYSMPWFDGRPALRGGSFASAERMKHPRYRNFFAAERNDVFAGFRSCAPAAAD